MAFAKFSGVRMAPTFAQSRPIACIFSCETQNTSSSEQCFGAFRLFGVPWVKLLVAKGSFLGSLSSHFGLGVPAPSRFCTCTILAMHLLHMDDSAPHPPRKTADTNMGGEKADPPSDSDGPAQTNAACSRSLGESPFANKEVQIRRPWSRMDHAFGMGAVCSVLLLLITMYIYIYVSIDIYVYIYILYIYICIYYTYIYICPLGRENTSAGFLDLWMSVPSPPSRSQACLSASVYVSASVFVSANVSVHACFLSPRAEILFPMGAAEPGRRPSNQSASETVSRTSMYRSLSTNAPTWCLQPLARQEQT